MKTFKKFLEKVQKEELIKDGDRIVLGFSGGPDSVFLFQMLIELKKQINFDFVLAHINHLLRGEDSDGDENFSRSLAKEYGIEIFVKRIDIKEKGKNEKTGLEEAGRKARYEFFEEVLKITKSNKIALAHNLDDQIETFLFRMIRGSSLEGLEGVNSRDIFIRPINELYKNEIIEYLNNNQISYRIDLTNFENDFTRNSIRLDLIPFIEKRYNPNFKDKVYTLIREIREVNSILDVDYKKYMIGEHISLEKIQKESEYIQSKLIVNYLHDNSIEVSREKILKILEIFGRGGTKEIKLNKHCVLKKEYDKISIEKIEFIEPFSDEVKFLKIPGKIQMGRYILEAETSMEEAKGKNEFLTNLKVGDKLCVRFKKDGDKILPTGMNNYKKLKDIFINEKIPKDERESIPIVTFEEDIVWIAGVRGSEKFKSLENEGERVKLSVRRKR